MSRAGRMSPSFTYESSARILEEVQEELSYQLEREKVRLVIHQDLPLIHCDGKGSIRQVFANLIGKRASRARGPPSLSPCP